MTKKINLVKTAVAMLCFIVVLSAVLLVNAGAATSSAGRGSFTDNDQLHMEKRLEKQPMTYAATFKLADGKSGSIISNYRADNRNAIKLSVTSSGYPQLKIVHEANVYATINFTDAIVDTGEWVDLVITHEVNASSEAVFTCYLNGAKCGESVTYTREMMGGSSATDAKYATHKSCLFSDVKAMQERWPFTIGKDPRASSINAFGGSLQRVALYSKALTETEIAKLYENTSDSSMLVYYDFTVAKNQSGNHVIDSSGNGIDLKPIFAERENEIGDEYKYSIAIIPDTQNINKYDVFNKDTSVNYSNLLSDPTNQAYIDAYFNGTAGDSLSYIYDWLVANKESKNIQLVLGVGDVTNDDGKDTTTGSKDDGIDQTDLEWIKAVMQYNKLSEAGIPYALVQGNGPHDTVAQLSKFFDTTDSDGNGFDSVNANFGAFESASYFGGKSSITYMNGNDLGNYYIKCEINGIKYMVLCLQYAPVATVGSSAIGDFANEAIAANSDHSVIVLTHGYLSTDGERNDNGEKIWKEFASKHENVIMVISGHEASNFVVHSAAKGECGNTVNQLLVDFQDADVDYKTKSGMVAMLYFSEDGSKVKVEYVSTYMSAQSSDGKDMLYRQGENSYVFNLNGDVIEEPEIPGGNEPELPEVNEPEIPEEPEIPTVDYESLITDAAVKEDKDKYPFAIFDRDENGDVVAFVKGCSYWGLKDVGVNDKDGSKNSNNAYSAAHNTRTANRLVYMRRDFEANDTKLYSNWSNTLTNVIIDFGGYTFTWNPQTSGRMFDLQKKSANDTQFTVRNGNIILKNGDFISFDSNTTDYSQYGFEVAFERIDLSVAADNKNPPSRVLSNGSFSSGEKPLGKAHLTYTDCNIDFANLSSPEIFRMSFVNYCNDIKVTFNGGSIKAPSSFKFEVLSSGQSSPLTFGKGSDGSYTTFITAKSDFAQNVNGGALTFKAVSTSDGMINYRLVPTVALNLDFTPKASVTLDSSIILNIYVPEHSGLGSVKLNGKTVELGEATDGYYHIAKVLAPSESANSVKLAVELTVGGSKINGTFTFSTVKYVKKLLEMNENDVTNALAMDMLAYVKSAYEYFGGSDKSSVIKEINAILGSYEKNEIDKVAANAPTDPDDIIEAVTLSLDSVPAIRFYLSSGKDAAAYTFKAGGSTVEYTSGVESNDNGYKGYTYCDISLYAYKMISEITITVGGSSATYHINAYYENVDKTDAELYSVVVAFYNYCVSADKYRASVIGK